MNGTNKVMLVIYHPNVESDFAEKLRMMTSPSADTLALQLREGTLSDA